MTRQERLEALEKEIETTQERLGDATLGLSAEERERLEQDLEHKQASHACARLTDEELEVALELGAIDADLLELERLLRQKEAMGGAAPPELDAEISRLLGRSAPYGQVHED